MLNLHGHRQAGPALERKRRARVKVPGINGDFTLYTRIRSGLSAPTDAGARKEGT